MRSTIRRNDGITRAERSAQARRARARAHLERIRGQGPAPRSPGLPGPTLLALAVLVTSVSAGMGFGAGWRPHPVDRVWVEGAHWLRGAEIAEAAGLGRGAPPGEVDPATVSAQLAANPWIERARVLTLPNGVLLVSVVEREPAALLTGPEPWAVDAEGVPFAKAPPDGLEDLPQLEAARPPEPGRADPDLARAVAVVRSLPGRGLPAPRQIAIAAPDDPEGLSLVLTGVAPRIVLGRDDLDARLADLARLLDAGLPEIEQATRIDLRFEDQAVLDGGPTPEGAAQAAASRGGAASSNSRRSG